MDAAALIDFFHARTKSPARAGLFLFLPASKPTSSNDGAASSVDANDGDGDASPSNGDAASPSGDDASPNAVDPSRDDGRGPSAPLPA